MRFRSTLYVGSVMHRRLRPRPHYLRYRMFWMLLDLDEIDQLPRGLRLFSRNRFNALSLYDADHGADGGRTLREQAETHLKGAGIDCGGGRIELLCLPRIFGYGFNPLSIYFCCTRGGSLAAILYEVHNTFGERHSYLIPAGGDPGSAIPQECRKVFYVSPFMGMDLTYQFRVAAPGEKVSARINVSDGEGKLLVAALEGTRRTLSDTALLRVIVSHPLLTLKVVAAIHWHALRLWLKGIRLHKRPAPPPEPVTIVSGNGRQP